MAAANARKLTRIYAILIPRRMCYPGTLLALAFLLIGIGVPPVELGLDSFYQKYTNAGKIAVAGSGRVPDKPSRRPERGQNCRFRGGQRQAGKNRLNLSIQTPPDVYSNGLEPKMEVPILLPARYWHHCMERVDCDDK